MTRLKPPNPGTIAARLTVPERVLLFSSRPTLIGRGRRDARCRAPHGRDKLDRP
jgi:hypothetical protein